MTSIINNKIHVACDRLSLDKLSNFSIYREEMAKLQNNIDNVSRKLEAPQHNQWRGIPKPAEANCPPALRLELQYFD